jgi:hypothetical protein
VSSERQVPSLGPINPRRVTLSRLLVPTHRNVGNYTPVDTAEYFRTLEFSRRPLRAPQMSQTKRCHKLLLKINSSFGNKTLENTLCVFVLEKETIARSWERKTFIRVLVEQ